MPRILAIDFGLKRTGIAVTDPLQIIAAPLQTVDTNELMKFLSEYFGKEDVETIVIGDPKNLDGTASEIKNEVDQLEEDLKRNFPEKKVARVDERFTSRMAQQSLIASGIKKKKRSDKSLLDKVSAALILQHYLDSRKK